MQRLTAVLALCVAAAVRVGETVGAGVVRQDLRSAPTRQHSQLKNVFFVVADDLRPQLNRAYQHPWMKTPHLDEFTETALVFHRAYVQQQVCSPSRNSFLTGRRPDQTRVWNFIDDFRVHRTANKTAGHGHEVDSPHPAKGGETDAPGPGALWTTLPQYFKQHGYQVYGTGKTFHPNRPMNNDLPQSWTSYDDGMDMVDMGCNDGKPLYAATVDNSTGEGSAWKRIIGCEMNDQEALLTNATVRYLSNLEKGKPFFVMMGHHKPHLPWFVPQRFFDELGDPLQYAVAQVQVYPASADKLNWHPWFDQLRITDVEPLRKQQYLRRGYYAAVAYFDYHFGQVMAQLEKSGQAQHTVILMTGDHGYHLGERNQWEKKGLDELDCRVPLLIRAPWIPAASRGYRTSALAEHVDIMPTLIDLAGLPACTEDLGGESLVPIIHNPPATGTGLGKMYTFSQFPRCNCSYATPVLDVKNGTCSESYVTPWVSGHGATGATNKHVCLYTESKFFDWMGYSVRSDAWRYTIWVAWNGDLLKPVWQSIQGTELFEHKTLSGDFDGEYSEPFNRAVNPDAEAQATMTKLHRILIAQFSRGA